MVTLGVNILVGSRSQAFSVASALMVMTYSLVDVSGSHFNPAVTLAAYRSGNSKLSYQDCVRYIEVQAAAAVLGGVCTGYLNHEAPSSNAPLILGSGDGWQLWQATIGELMFTVLLAYVTLVFSLPIEIGPTSKQNPLFGLIIASCMTAGGFAVGVISGGLFNPALALGITIHSSVHRVSGTTSSWNAFPNYVSAQIVGGVFAASLFRLTHRKTLRESTLLDARDSEVLTTAEEAPDTSVISSEEVPEVTEKKTPGQGARAKSSQD